MQIGTIHCALALIFLATPTLAQSNVVPGTDVELGLLDVGSDFDDWGHEGGALTGESAFSMSTTSCNPGTTHVPWLAAMQDNHPLIAFMCVREEADQSRLVQISDRSWVKHGFFALSSNQCNYGCSQVSGGTFLAIGCSDTYGIGNNGSRDDLGPPEEVDPWLGTWNGFGSFFDCPSGSGCDGGRSYFGNEPSQLTHRVRIQDSDLNVPGATFSYYGYYVIRAEPEANRDNNGNSRNFTPSWTGNSWNTNEGNTSTNPHQQGTILQRWTGATIASNLNNNGGVDRDGRVFVASKVTGVAGGNYHYEYALHNRDNNGAISEFRIPLGTGVNVSTFGFHDVDQDVTNRWGSIVIGNEIVFSTDDNPLYWNTVYNFWFNCDAPPVARDLELVQYVPNPGAAPSFTVTSVGPGDGNGPQTFTSICNGDGGDQAGCTDCPCGNNMPAGTIGGCQNSSLSSSRLHATGDPSASADTMRFELTGAPTTAFCVLVSGDQVAPTAVASPCFGFGTGVQAGAFDGLRCAVGNMQSQGGRRADAAGNVGVTGEAWGGSSPPSGGLIANGGFTAGQTRHYQVINRESPLSACMNGLNTSQAISVTIQP